MITNFQQFGPLHLTAITIAGALGTAFILWAQKANSPEVRKKITILFAVVIVAVRAVRYVMDIFYGVFDWYDLFSLQICHIDLILLVICLIKPNRALFSFVFLIGIPASLAVALFPGANHPAPGEARAVLFIMSHVMLTMGAVYLAVIEKIKIAFRHYLYIAAAGNCGMILLFFLNSLLGSNFLYINYAPPGTIIEKMAILFGWPGYVIVMDALAMGLMLGMYGIGRVLQRNIKCRDNTVGKST